MAPAAFPARDLQPVAAVDGTADGWQGWTMGCGSGKVVADLVSGRRPEMDF
jgi:glycine/D-amino acid oxidase-like deaminating enzyme